MLSDAFTSGFDSYGEVTVFLSPHPVVEIPTARTNNRLYFVNSVVRGIVRGFLNDLISSKDIITPHR